MRFAAASNYQAPAAEALDVQHYTCAFGAAQPLRRVVAVSRAPIDLRDFRWMQFDILALQNSWFFSTATPEEGWAAFRLWMAAWHQVPAGTLPNDERWLCSRAGLGQDLKRWAVLRGMALHGFKLSDPQLGGDGLLHHAFLEDKADAAQTFRDQRVGAANARWAKIKKTKRKPDHAVALLPHCGGNARDRTGLEEKKETLRVSKEAPLRVARGARLPDGWVPSEILIGWAKSKLPHLSGATLTAETEAFTDWARAAPGQRGVKLDWDATWRNWMRRAGSPRPGRHSNVVAIGPTKQFL